MARFEIKPVKEHEDGTCEVAEDGESFDFWTVYAVNKDGTATAVSDHKRLDDAIEHKAFMERSVQNGFTSKTYSMAAMKSRDIDNVRKAIKKMGFSTTDYKIVEFGNSHELKIMSKELHRMIKSMSKLFRVKAH